MTETTMPATIMHDKNLEQNKENPYDKEIPYFFSRLQMITSKLTSKSQTTVPKSIRRALNLSPGDLLSYEISGDRVILTRAPDSTGEDDPFRCFDEWSGKEDEDAYASL